MENKLQLAQAKDFILPNGLKVIYAQDKSNPIISIQFYVKTGSTNESDLCRGYSHFLEHLTFKSTANFPRNTISDLVPKLGGVINAYTEFDTTCYYLMLPAEFMKQGLEIISDLAFRAEFSSEDLAVEKDIIIEEIKQYDNEPDSSFIEWIQNSYFASNPLKHPILGTKESIASATLQSCLEFYQKNYRPDNCFMVIAGYFETSEIMSQITRMFNVAPYQSIPNDAIINIAPEGNGFELKSHKNKSDDSYLAVVMPELVENDVYSDAMLLLMKAFAADKNSRLYKRLVEKDKIALGIKLHSISGRYPGITIIQITPFSDMVIADIIYAVYDELCKIKQELLTSDEIDLIKREMHYSWLNDFGYIESIASSLASEEIIGNYRELYNFPQRINNISNELLAESLNKYWKSEYMGVYFQGKITISKNLKDNIRKLFVNAFSQLPDITANGFVTVNLQDKMPVFTQSSHKLYSKTANDYMEDRLDNGMRIICRKVLHKPTISLSITTPISQLYETIDNRGINYFTSVLMLYGTKSRKYQDIQIDSLKKGYSVKVNHTIETTTFRGKCFHFNFESMLSTLADLIQNPSFPIKHLSIAKSSIIDNIRREKSSPFNFSYNNWIDLFLGKHTNLNKSYGNITQTQKLALNMLQDWYDYNYTISDFCICAAGDIDFKNVKDLCNSYFNNKPVLASNSTERYILRHSDFHFKKVKTASDQSNIIIGGMGCPATDVLSNTAFYVLAQILGGDLSSRFFNILREKYGYAYQTGFDFTSVKNLGYWFAYVICDKSDNYKSLDLLLNILEDICFNGVTQDELDSAKNYLLGLHKFDMESLGWQSNSLSILYSLGYDYDYFIDREKRIKAINLDIIRAVARQWLQKDNMYIYFES